MRAHTGRPAVIAFDGGYGRTNFTLGLTGKNAPYKLGFGPFLGDIYRAPFPIDYHGISEEQSLKTLDMLFTCDVEAKDVAAIILIREEADKQDLSMPDGFTVEWVIEADLGAKANLLADAARNVAATNELVYAWVACEFEAMKLLRQYLRTEQNFGKDRLYIPATGNAALSKMSISKSNGQT